MTINDQDYAMAVEDARLGIKNMWSQPTSAMTRLRKALLRAHGERRTPGAAEWCPVCDVSSYPPLHSINMVCTHPMCPIKRAGAS